MPHFRIYINREITEEGGGEHLRVIDLEASTIAEARSTAQSELEPHEQTGEVVELAPNWGQG